MKTHRTGLVLAVVIAMAHPSWSAAEPSCRVPPMNPDEIKNALAQATELLKAFGKVKEVSDWAKDQIDQKTPARPAMDPTHEIASRMLDDLSSIDHWPARLARAADGLDDLADRREARAEGDRDDGRARSLRDEANTLRRAAKALRQVPAPSTITVEEETLVSVVLTNPPATRVRLSADRIDGHGHAEAEWDPAIDEELIRRFDLGEGTWSLSASIENTFIQQGDGSLVIAAKFDGIRSTGDTFTLSAVHTALVADKGLGRTTAEQVPMTGWPEPTLTFRCGPEVRESIDDVKFSASGQARPSEQRGLGVAPEIVTETLSILAEIAVERARSGAMTVLKDQFVSPLCTKDGGVQLLDVGLGTSAGLLLPRSCDLLDTLRLDDVLASGTALLRALRDDLRFTVVPALLMQIAGDRAFAPIARDLLEIANRAIDRGSFDGIEAELMLELLTHADELVLDIPAHAKGKLGTVLTTLLASNQQIRQELCGGEADVAKCLETKIVGTIVLRDLLALWSPSPDERKQLEQAITMDLQAGLDELAPRAAIALRLACPTRLAVAIIKRCTSSRCTIDKMGDMLSRPQKYFKPDERFPASMCWRSDELLGLPESIAKIRRLIIEGIELTAPVRQTTGKERAIAAIRLLVSLIDGIMGPDGDVVIVGEIAVALIEERYDTALTAGIRLIKRLMPGEKPVIPDGLKKASQLVGAVAAYVEVYRSTKDDSPTAAREARKKALESLIDAATDRSDRGGDRVVSIGSNVGLSLTNSNAAQYGPRPDLFDDHSEAAVRVPLGIAVQWLPGGACEPNPRDGKLMKGLRCIGCARRHLGFHLGFQIADLGQLARAGADTIADDVHWSSFLSPGVEAGLLVGGSAHAVNVTLHGSFAPGLADPSATDRRGVWRYGIAIGYYVPFFDLN